MRKEQNNSDNYYICKEVFLLFPPLHLKERQQDRNVAQMQHLCGCESSRDRSSEHRIIRVTTATGIFFAHFAVNISESVVLSNAMNL